MLWRRARVLQGLLEYLEDDGQSIEPKFYVPVLPLVLINGAEGIGTGWSSSVPNYNPRDVVANIKKMMGGDEPEGIKSYWWFKVQRGFTAKHCDGTALPKCMAAWIPMVDVDGGVEVGTLALQAGSHLGKWVHHDTVQRPGRLTSHSGDGALRDQLIGAAYEENEQNGCELVKVVASAGDVVLVTSNGAFGGIWEKLLAKLEAAEGRAAGSG